jgi:hypothetical protein
MKTFATLFVVVITINLGACQTNTNYFKDNFRSIDLEYFIFHEFALVECVSDTSIRKHFEHRINDEVQKIKVSDVVISKERKIFLHLLYNRIKVTKIIGKELKLSKGYLLEKLNAFKTLDFSLDYNLIEERLNPQTRGMPFGDEECSIDISLLIFFAYNPKLYIDVVTTSKTVKAIGKMRFPAKCFLEELSYLPQDLKKKTQGEMLKLLDNYQGGNFDALRNRIKNANLKAHYN